MANFPKDIIDDFYGKDTDHGYTGIDYDSDDEVTFQTFEVIVNESLDGTNYDGYDSDPYDVTGCFDMKNVYYLTMNCSDISLDDIKNNPNGVVQNIKKKVRTWSGYLMCERGCRDGIKFNIRNSNDNHIHNHVPRHVSNQQLTVVSILHKKNTDDKHFGKAAGDKQLYPPSDYYHDPDFSDDDDDDDDEMRYAEKIFNTRYVSRLVLDYY